MKAITVATAGLAATAATADAATLSLDSVRACYLSGTQATISGSGFAAGAPIEVTEDGEARGSTVADTSGAFAATWNFGGLNAAKSHTITATDGATAASVTYMGTTYRVATRKSKGRAGRKYKLRGYGFLFGRKAFMHVRGHGVRRDVFLARPKAPCGTFTVKQRIAPAGSPFGDYKVQFDAKKKYSKKTPNALHFTLNVFPRASAAAAGWTLAR
ncbi:MAG TPA: hypothetical protein VFM58_03250 [Solirubrobacteraceae bacterium]|nr:hypothetical protein [Solirubrobacteraceae bacterium]